MPTTPKSFFIRRWIVKTSSSLENGKENDSFAIQDRKDQVGGRDRIGLRFPPDYGPGNGQWTIRVGPGWYERGFVFAEIGSEGLLLAFGQQQLEPTRELRCCILENQEGLVECILEKGLDCPEAKRQEVGEFGAEEG